MAQLVGHDEPKHDPLIKVSRLGEGDHAVGEDIRVVSARAILAGPRRPHRVLRDT